MPPITRWFIKAGLAYFVAALLVGMALAARAVWNLPRIAATLGPVYFHLFMVGWVTQLIFGVVYWMFPKYSKEKPHGSEALWLATLWLLNIGLLLRVIGEPLHTLRPEALWGWLLAISALLQWSAGLGFALNTWGRVKER
jgi:cbb3-type cytochrome oxidase subunit 1